MLKGWTRSQLGNLGAFHKGKGITKSELSDDGVPCLRYAEIYTKFGDVTSKLVSFVPTESASEATSIKYGDIIFAASGETSKDIGKATAFVGRFDAVAGGDTVILRDHGQDPSFLAHFLNSHAAVKQKSRLGKGQSIVHIHASDLAGVTVDLPPLAEQLKIAEILRTWDAAIEKLQDLRSANQNRYNAIARQFFDPCHPTFHGRPNAWVGLELGDVFHERNQSGLDEDRLLSITMNGGVIDRDEVGRKDTSTADKSKYKLILPGDIGYNTMRMWQGVSGLSALRGIISPAYTVVSPITDRIVGHYAAHLFKSHRMIFDFERYSQGLTSDTWNLKFPAFSKIRAFLPPIVEQEKQAELLDSLNDEGSVICAQLGIITRQKYGLMQKLLTGEWRVNLEDVV